MNDLNRLHDEYEARKSRYPADGRYSMANQSYLFTIQRRMQAIKNLINEYHLEKKAPQKILEIGCGSGGVLMEFQQKFPNVTLTGIDLLYDRLVAAKATIPSAGICNADCQTLPFPPASFDLVLQFTAFSSILDPKIKQRMASDMLRVVKDDGAIIWYDFWWNPINRQTRGITPREIRALFPDCQFQFRKITLAPPIARRIVPLSRKLAVFLEALGIFNSHYLVLITG